MSTMRNAVAAEVMTSVILPREDGTNRISAVPSAAPMTAAAIIFLFLHCLPVSLNIRYSDRKSIEKFTRNSMSA